MFSGLAATIGTGTGAAITTGTTLGAILGTQKIGNHQIEYMAGGTQTMGTKYDTVQTTRNRDLTGWTPSVGTTDEFGETVYGASIQDIRSIAYGKDLWVAAGDDGTDGSNNVMSSPDGKFWTFSTGTNFYASTGGSGALSVAYGNGTWLVGGHAVISNRNLYKSTDGQNWSLALKATTEVGFKSKTVSVGYGKGRFVALGEKETGYNTTIMYSDDNGSNWARSTVPSTFEPNTSATFGGGTDVAYGSNNNWVAVGDGTLDPVNSVIFSTNNGKLWSSCFSIKNPDGTDLGGTPVFTCVAYGNGTWVAGGSPTTPIIYSKDPEGKRWTVVDGEPSDLVDAHKQTVIYDGTRFLMNGLGSIIYSSLDGITWEEVTDSTGGLSDLHELAYKP